jgi:hypothetical protein
VHAERVTQRPALHTWLEAQAESAVHRQRPVVQTKPWAQSVAWVHSGRAAQAPAAHTCPLPHSASSRQMGPQPP